MSKWRIVQVKPDGLPQAYIIEEFVVIPATTEINSKYMFMRSYYEQQGRLNVGGLPSDYRVAVPSKEIWKDMGQWYYRDTKDQAEQAIRELQTLANLNEELKTFKRKVIKEYD